MLRTFIIAEPDPVIRLDLVGAIESAFPMGVIDVAPDASDLSSRIASHQNMVCILISQSLVDDTVRATLKAAIAEGAQVAILGAADVDAKASVIEMPFTDDMIVDAFR